jgi:hypothetical protein
MALEDIAGSPESETEEGDLPVSEGGSPKAKKRRAVKRMFQAAKEGDWDGAMEAFADAFEACEEYSRDDEGEGESDVEEGYEDDDEEA